jgi:Tol biopolymer transport system component
MAMQCETVSSGEFEAHLDRVLDSATFRGSERSSRLLRFIVSETLAGRGDRLKEYTLGAEALGRGVGFDPRADPIARVEASRLRSRLDAYYATEGASDIMRIVVPKGGYVPQFETRSKAPDKSEPRSIPGDPEASADAHARAGRGWGWGWSAIWGPIVGAAAAAVATWWLMSPRGAPTPAPEVRLELTTPSTTDPASLAISPDGQTLAFIASGGEVQRLWVRGLGNTDARPLTGTEYASFPFWSPDGRAIGFFADGRVKSIDLKTQLVRTLSSAPVPAGAAWNRDGVLLHPLVPDSPLFRTTENGAKLAPATRLISGHTGHRGPVFLPDHRHFLFFAAGSAETRGVYLGELGTPSITRLLDADAPAVFVSPASLLYVKDSTLFSRRFDPASATVSGEAVRLVDNVGVEPSAGLAAVVASSSGTIAYRRGLVGSQRQFIWFDRQGKEIERIGVPEERGPAYGSISPDGRHLAVQRTMEGNTDIWLVDIERGSSIRFTTEPQADIAPVFSPRGDRIAYASQVDRVFELFEKPLDGGSSRLLVRTGQAKQITDWSRDGRYLLYRSVATSPTPDMDIWAVALDGDRTPVAVVRTTFEERDAQFSPDGMWVAYQSNESGRHEVYVGAFNRGGERLRISTSGGVQARWRSDGRELFYLTLEGQLMAVPMAPGNDGRSVRPGAPVHLFRTSVGSTLGVALHSYFVAPGGQRFLLDAVVEQQASPIALILNWKPPVS